MHSDITNAAAALLTIVFVAIGCSSRVPSRVRPPSISPARAGRDAMAQYDTDQDGIVKGEELGHAPALEAAREQLDANHDGGVSADEVANRVKAWQASRVGKTSLGCIVTLDGRPLSGAKIIFEPETFLGGEIQPCVGITDDAGIANLSVELTHADDVPGAACGLYRVRISKESGGKELIPARYNSNTKLGQEISLDAPELKKGLLRFNLSSR